MTSSNIPFAENIDDVITLILWTLHVQIERSGKAKKKKKKKVVVHVKSNLKKINNKKSCCAAFA
jgi:hypothetical protein